MALSTMPRTPAALVRRFPEAALGVALSAGVGAGALAGYLWLGFVAGGMLGIALVCWAHPDGAPVLGLHDAPRRRRVRPVTRSHGSQTHAVKHRATARRVP